MAGVAPTSLVMVVTRSVAEARQWAARLADRDVVVRLLAGASDALELLESLDRLRDGAIVTTFSRLRSGPSRRVLASVRPDLLIWDDPASSLPVELADQARQVVALVSEGDGQHWAQWSVLLAVGTEVLHERGHPTVREVPFEVSREELELRTEARALLRNLGVEHPQRWSNSLPSLHARLLARATDAGEHLSTQVWAVLDRIENAPPDDDRRNVLRRTLAGVASLSRPCLVVAPTPADAIYTADQLAGAASAPVPVIDATLSATGRRSVLAGLAPGQCVVATPVLDDLWHELPSGSVVVLLPFPDGSGLPGRIADAVADIPGLDIIRLREVPSPVAG
ncbi:hypothetical protein KBX37_17420 [Micromonospora sp. U56]|uniref:hypothetical protein n=1 Tax=Micromonospora sp. U56 TaxID=2824900 RepID=UPI001B39A789|nr:hypothetical protein [Micromonospora sp. U56]MBQ0894858.1 hypothetical protein [Micromonospora sp. U56]